jgi:hypothetical protein
LLKNELVDRDIAIVYFNAWENDFYREPLPAIIAEIGSLFPKEEENLLELKKIGISLLKAGVPQIIKLITAGVLDLKGVVEEVVNTAATDYFSQKVDEYSETKENIKIFKEKLKLLVSEKDHSKIVIIIDELDRCRPLFAIEVLEIVKHLFSVDGVSFVISIDHNQLSASIRKLYGQDIDVHGYLNRFIDLYMPLPEPNLKNYCDYLFERFEYSEFFKQRQEMRINDKGQFIDAIVEISKMYTLSLRDIEKVFIRMTLVFMTTEPKYFLFPYILVFLLIANFKDPDIYNRVINKEIELDEFIKYLEGKDVSKVFVYGNDSYAGQILCGNMAVFLADDEKRNAYEYLDKIISDENQDVNLKRWAESVKSIGQDTRSGRPFYGMMKYIKEKIEITGKIQN